MRGTSGLIALGLQIGTCTDPVCKLQNFIGLLSVAYASAIVVVIFGTNASMPTVAKYTTKFHRDALLLCRNLFSSRLSVQFTKRFFQKKKVQFTKVFFSRGNKGVLFMANSR